MTLNIFTKRFPSKYEKVKYPFVFLDLQQQAYFGPTCCYPTAAEPCRGSVAGCCLGMGPPVGNTSPAFKVSFCPIPSLSFSFFFNCSAAQRCHTDFSITLWGEVRVRVLESSGSSLLSQMTSCFIGRTSVPAVWAESAKYLLASRLFLNPLISRRHTKTTCEVLPPPLHPSTTTLVCMRRHVWHSLLIFFLQKPFPSWCTSHHVCRLWLS